MRSPPGVSVTKTLSSSIVPQRGLLLPLAENLVIFIVSDPASRRGERPGVRLFSGIPPAFSWGRRLQGSMITTAPGTTFSTISSKASLFILMHPSVVVVPSEDGSWVPWIPMPFQPSVSSRIKKGP